MGTQGLWLVSLSEVGKGVGTTLMLTISSLVGGLSIGILLAVLIHQKISVVGFLARAYVFVFTGTPLLVQLSLIYFGLPYFVGYTMNVLVAGCLAFSLNSGAYVAEIVRSGIQSIDTGQFDAAAALDVPGWLMWKDIVIPQVVTAMLPSLINEVASLIKETALISCIGGVDIMRQAQMVAAEHYTYFQPLLVAALYYFMLVSLVRSAAYYLQRDPQ